MFFLLDSHKQRSKEKTASSRVNSPHKALVARSKTSFCRNFVQRLIGAVPSVFDARRTEGKVAAEESSEDCPTEDSDGIGTDKFSHESHRGILENAHDVLSHEVEILLAHFCDLLMGGEEKSEKSSGDSEETYLIFHFSRIVLDDECIFLPLRLLIERIFFLNIVELMQEILVAAAGKAENFTSKSLSIFIQTKR